MREPKVTGEDPDATRVFERPAASGVDPVTAQLDDATLISDPLPDGQLVSPPAPPVAPAAAAARMSAGPAPFPRLSPMCSRISGTSLR